MKVSEVRRLALGLAEATEEPHFHYSSFRVRGRIFATMQPDGEHLHVFVADAQREIALELDPEFLEKLRWGARVVGLRVALAKAKPRVVARLLEQAWARKAPRSLAAKAAR
ncbi:MAG: MmcQ/YjbR family DNA-binding protein [Usitatibacter sp.]